MSCFVQRPFCSSSSPTCWRRSLLRGTWSHGVRASLPSFPLAEWIPRIDHAFSETGIFLIGIDVHDATIGRDVDVKLTGLIHQPFVGVFPHDSGTGFHEF